jgi:sarcosine oxidase
MRIAVVGAGVIGLLTAVECVRAGARVELVDRGAIPCPEAASYDVHRVVRTLHRGDAALTRAAARLPADWSRIERELGGNLRFLHRTGVLTSMAEPDARAELALLAELGTEARYVSAALAAERYPQVRLPAGMPAVFEPGAATILAGWALRAIADWLRAQPAARLHPHRAVTAVDDDGAVHLADGGVLAADAVVIAAGPWSRDLLPDGLGARLTLKRQTMLTYSPGARRAACDRCPAVLGLGPGHDGWLIPPVGGSPARLSAASACRTVERMTDRQTPAVWREHLVARFRDRLAAFDEALVTGSTEGYYLTDEQGSGPMLAELGGPVLAYAACGGMSFKFAPPVARALADRALGRPPRPTGLDRVDRPYRPAMAGIESSDRRTP